MKKRTHYLKLSFSLVICACVLMIIYSPAVADDFKKEYKLQINVGSQFY